jgi:hypothetical protein
MRSLKKRPADEPLLDPDRHFSQKRSRNLRRSTRSKRRNRQPNAFESLSGLQDETAFQTQLERAISLVLAAQGFEGATPEALESFRGLVEQCEKAQSMRLARLTLCHLQSNYNS